VGKRKAKGKTLVRHGPLKARGEGNGPKLPKKEGFDAKCGEGEKRSYDWEGPGKSWYNVRPLESGKVAGNIRKSRGEQNMLKV